ncbi:ATP-binding protein [Ottowia sp. VDI28]
MSTDTMAVLRATAMADLPAMATLIERACTGMDADAQAQSELRLAAEEVFTNIFRHGYRSASGPVTVTVAATPWPSPSPWLIRRRISIQPAWPPPTSLPTGRYGPSAGWAGTWFARSWMRCAGPLGAMGATSTPWSRKFASGRHRTS